jgi:hypothetical protein
MVEMVPGRGAVTPAFLCFSNSNSQASQTSMTPTLLGRWQTRILLYVVLGLPITLLYSLYLKRWVWPPFLDPFVFLSLILVIGLILDVLYIQLQRLRWDADWPFAFQFVVSIAEFGLVWWLMSDGWFDQLLLDAGGRIPLDKAATHFAWVFIPSFIALLGPLQIFLIRWRFKGGELGKMSVN